MPLGFDLKPAKAKKVSNIHSVSLHPIAITN